MKFFDTQKEPVSKPKEVPPEKPVIVKEEKPVIVKEEIKRIPTNKYMIL